MTRRRERLRNKSAYFLIIKERVQSSMHIFLLASLLSFSCFFCFGHSLAPWLRNMIRTYAEWKRPIDWCMATTPTLSTHVSRLTSLFSFLFCLSVLVIPPSPTCLIWYSFISGSLLFFR